MHRGKCEKVGIIPGRWFTPFTVTRHGNPAQAQVPFVRRALSLRRRYGLLRRNRFLRGEYDEVLRLRDIDWRHPDGHRIEEADWHDPELRALLIVLEGRSTDSGLREPGRHVSLALLFNAGEQPQVFQASGDVLACSGSGTG
ncbi:hypothetical protein [Xanthomonas retroflexus]|uniref:hypothetical protein n=1 Tax=Stenotrophomonas indicatrix TaxID=2045451 RepID=UPI00296F42F5